MFQKAVYFTWTIKTKQNIIQRSWGSCSLHLSLCLWRGWFPNPHVCSWKMVRSQCGSAGLGLGELQAEYWQPSVCSRHLPCPSRASASVYPSPRWEQPHLFLPSSPSPLHSELMEAVISESRGASWELVLHLIFLGTGRLWKSYLFKLAVLFRIHLYTGSSQEKWWRRGQREGLNTQGRVKQDGRRLGRRSKIWGWLFDLWTPMSSGHPVPWAATIPTSGATLLPAAPSLQWPRSMGASKSSTFMLHSFGDSFIHSIFIQCILSTNSYPHLLSGRVCICINLLYN